MPPPARLISIATAVPAHVLEQNLIAAEAARVFGPRFREFDKLAQVFRSAGIRKRHAARPLEWFLESRGWPERTKAYLETAGSLFVKSAGLALKRAGLAASDIDTVVTVSSTGIATPSLEAQVASRLGFHTGIERVPVFGLGCAGGTSGLAIAARLAQSRPGSNVLLVTVELCTLAFRLDKLTKANIVATALFGDGAAACVVKAGEEGLASVEMSAQTTWPDTLQIMGWSVEPQGFGVIFDRTIPPFARENLGSAVREILAKNSLLFSDIGRFVCHPGGTKVLEALEEALELGEGALDTERAVLADYGNMSAPTVLFVLERLLADPLPDRSMLMSLGPGFSASCVSLRADL